MISILRQDKGDGRNDIYVMLRVILYLLSLTYVSSDEKEKKKANQP